jgi:hypothetical protein
VFGIRLSGEVTAIRLEIELRRMTWGIENGFSSWMDVVKCLRRSVEIGTGTFKFQALA